MANFLDALLQGMAQGDARRARRAQEQLERRRLDEQVLSRQVDDQRANRALSIQESAAQQAAAERRQQREDEERRFIAGLIPSGNYRTAQDAERRAAVGSVIYGENPQKLVPSYTASKELGGAQFFGIPAQERAYDARAGALALARGQGDIQVDTGRRKLEAELGVQQRLLNSLNVSQEQKDSALLHMVAPNLGGRQPADQEALLGQFFEQDPAKRENYKKVWNEVLRRTAIAPNIRANTVTPDKQFELNAQSLKSQAIDIGREMLLAENPGFNLSHPNNQIAALNRSIAWLTAAKKAGVANPEAIGEAIAQLRKDNKDLLDMGDAFDRRLPQPKPVVVK